VTALRSSGLSSYALAIAAVAIATLCSLALQPAIERVPFALYFVAVIAAARFGGLLPALISAVLAVLAANYFVFPPPFQLKIAGLEEAIGLVILTATSIVVGSVTAQLRATTEAERRERESLATTLRSVGDGVIATDARGRVSLLNPVAETLTGWISTEAVGRPIEEIFRIVNEKTRQPVDNPVARVLVEGTIVGLANSTLLIARDGTERPIDDSGAPIRDEQGGVVGAVLVFRDITGRRAVEREREALLERERAAREAAEAARAQVSATLESITDAFYAVDQDWRFTYVNARAAGFQERRPEEVLGKVLWEAFPNVQLSPLAPVLRRVMETREPEQIVYLHPTRDTWRDAHVYPTQSGLAVYFQDVTERKQVEQQLARSRELLEESQRSGHIGSWEWDIAANVVAWSDELYRVYGLEPGSVAVTFETFLERVHPDDRANVSHTIEAALETRQPFGFDHRVIRPDGAVRVLHARGRVITDEDRVPVRMIGSGQDITERHEAEMSLRRQAELLELAHDAILVLDLEYRIRFWSRGSEETYGWSRDEALGRNAQALLQTRFPTSFEEVLSTALEQGRWDGELIHTTKSGEVLTVASRWAFQRDEQGQPVAILEINRDVTHQRQAERELQENEQRLQLALQSARMVAWEWDPTADRVTVNGDLREIYGTDVVSEASQGFAMVHPEDRERHEATVQASVASGTDYRSEFRIVRPDNGEVVWLEERGHPIVDADGRVVRLTGVVIDISGRKRAEAESERIFREFEAVVRQMPVGVIVAEAPDGAAMLVNEEARRITGFGFPEQLNIADYTAIQGFRGLRPDGSEYQPEEWPLARALRTGEVVIGEEMELDRGDGLHVPIRSSAAPIQDTDGSIVAAVVAFEDISEQRRLEQARQDFVSIVAHELRNPLAGIRGYAQLMKRRSSYDERAVNVIVSQVDQLERRLSDLTDLSRLEAGRLTLERRPADLVELVHAAVEQARGQSDRHKFRVEAPDRPVVGSWDRDRIGQVLTNLLTNAIKYSPQGGEVVVRVAEQGGEAVLSVSDQGLGIAPSDLPRLFERFYRAPDSGATARGLGLGLYIVKELVETHGGRIVAESAGEERGSTFTVSLPLDEESIRPLGASE
jgi:PAS domain S-box-containing protein